EHGEDPLLDVAAVDTDGAAADLVAVAHDVVGRGLGARRVLVEPVEPLRGGRGEGVVDRGPRAVPDGDVVVLVGPLEQRRVDDPDEGPRVLVDEADAVRDLQTGRAEQGARLVRLRRGEEDRVTRLSAGGRGQAGALLLADVLGDRAAEGAVLADRDVGQPAGAALLGPLLPRVELATGLARTTGHD